MRRAAGRLVAAVATMAVIGAGTLGLPAWSATPPPTPVPPHGSLSPFPTALNTESPSPRHPPKIGAKAFVLADLDTGQILTARKEDDRRPIASLTKIMTAVLALEEGKPGETVTVSADAAPPPNQVGISNLQLVPGEHLSLEDLLYALMLQSANDAAVAIAEHISGSPGAFVRDMNRRAAALGATDTRFASPNGLDDDGYSTAQDLARIMEAAMRKPLFREIVATKFYTVPGPPNGRDRKIQNRNVLLWLYRGTSGGKTGFTTAAGTCLVAVARRDERTLIAVLLGGRGEPFSDAAELFDHGFGSFDRIDAVAEDQPMGMRRVGGVPTPVAAAEGLTALVLRTDHPKMRLQVRVRPDAPAGAQPGTVVGTVTATTPGQVLGTVGLVVAPGPPTAWFLGAGYVLDAWRGLAARPSG